MSTVIVGTDKSAVPQDYAELFRLYYDFVVRLVSIKGIDDANKEDVASDLLVRFIQRRSLEKFDPSLTFMRDGELRPANFRTYLSAFVESYVRGYRDRQQKNKTRESLILDVPVESPNNGGRVSWVELNAFEYGKSLPSHEDDVVSLVVQENMVASLRAYLATIPKRSAGDQCDLVALLDAIVAQIRATGEYSVEALREKFGVSSTSMHNWVWWMKELLCEATGHPVPPKRPRRRKSQR